MLQAKACPGGQLSPAEAGTLTMMVLNRFIEQVDWRVVAETYLSAVVSDEDMALVVDALRSITKGGVVFAEPPPAEAIGAGPNDG